jgi:hypothetical protein
MMNERIKELYLQAHRTRHHDGDPALDGNPPTVYWQGEVSAQRFAGLIYKDIITVVAAHALTNDSAMDVFKNLTRIYEEECK